MNLELTNDTTGSCAMSSPGSSWLFSAKANGTAGAIINFVSLSFSLANNHRSHSLDDSPARAPRRHVVRILPLFLSLLSSFVIAVSAVDAEFSTWNLASHILIYREKGRKEKRKREEGISPDRHRIAALQARRAGERQGREGAGRGERAVLPGGREGRGWSHGGLLVSDRHYLSA